ncbi:hypothetical protein [Flavobacterium daejeonense]|uniref:hypothetical protein n=1 Tax=Flavobacterium daejeonense TaxID=350893 RepID=UPI00047926BD|nr:hypothetical protein [Flavobacterium daejeonense]
MGQNTKFRGDLVNELLMFICKLLDFNMFYQVGFFDIKNGIDSNSGVDWTNSQTIDFLNVKEDCSFVVTLKLVLNLFDLI